METTSIGVLIFVFVIAAVVIFFVKYTNKNNVDELVTVGYEPSNSKDEKGEFIEYGVLFAKKMGVSKDVNEAYNYFMIHFNSLRFSYVMETRKTLILVDIPAVIMEICKKWASEGSLTDRNAE